MKKKAYIVLVLLCAAVFIFYAEWHTAYAQDYDYSDIQESLDGSDVDFEEIVLDFAENNDSSIFQKIWRRIVEAIGGMYKECFASIASVMTIVLIMSIFRSFSATFRNGQVSETAFYAAYVLVFGTIGVIVGAASATAYSVINEIFDFMKVLVPTYALTVSFSTGTASSTALYGGLLGAVTLADAVILKVILPLINMYILTVLCNQLTGESVLSKLSQTIEGVTLWLQKSLVALVLGISAIRGILSPSIDNIKRSSMLKAASAVPGVGGMLNGIAETVLGAGSLIKNSVGIAGIVAIIIICLIPLIKLALYFSAFKLGSIIVQPVSDKRITEAFSQSAGAISLLIKSVMSSMLMFILSLAITAAAT